MKKNIILFDLDGTLTDPGEGITNSVAYALEHYGIHTQNKESLYPFIGPPLIESFMRFYDFEEAKAKEAVEIYREYFSAAGLFENEVYEGVEELLRSLKEQGKTLFVATSKPTIFAKQILEHFHLAQYFTDICGSNLDGSRTKKAEVIQFVLEEYEVTDISSVLMVGDREHDVIGAKTCGLQAAGVLYGYGSAEELKDCGADFIVKDVSNLKILLSL